MYLIQHCCKKTFLLSCLSNYLLGKIQRDDCPSLHSAEQTNPGQEQTSREMQSKRRAVSVWLASSAMSLFPPSGGHWTAEPPHNHFLQISTLWLLTFLLFSNPIFFMFSSPCPATNKIKPYNSFLPTFFFTYTNPHSNDYLILHVATEAFLLKP